jgi:hypothetical protein
VTYGVFAAPGVTKPPDAGIRVPQAKLPARGWILDLAYLTAFN